jgi:hypothetical protein
MKWMSEIVNGAMSERMAAPLRAGAHATMPLGRERRCSMRSTGLRAAGRAFILTCSVLGCLERNFGVHARDAKCSPFLAPAASAWRIQRAMPVYMSRLRGGGEDPIKAARAGADACLLSGVVVTHVYLSEPTHANCRCLCATAMAARAKQRQQEAAKDESKEAPPSAKNPSAALNVGKDEAQIMGMEGRAARLAAKSAAAKKQPHQKPRDDDSSSSEGAQPFVTSSAASKKAPVQDESSSDDSSSASVEDVAKKLACTSIGSKSGSSACMDDAAKKLAGVSVGSKHGGATPQASSKAPTKPKQVAPATPAVALPAPVQKNGAPPTAESAPTASAPAGAGDKGTSDKMEHANKHANKAQALLAKIEAFLEGTEEEIKSLPSALKDGGAEGAARFDKDERAQLWRTLAKSMAEMDAAMLALEQLRQHGNAQSLPLPLQGGEAGGESKGAGVGTQSGPQDGAWMLTSDDSLHHQFGATEIVVTKTDPMELPLAGVCGRCQVVWGRWGEDRAVRDGSYRPYASLELPRD